MRKVRVTAVDGRKVQAEGKWLTAIGNQNIAVGSLVWTDGRCVYGHKPAVGGGSDVIGSQGRDIPLFMYYWYHYLYNKGQPERISTKGNYRYMLHRGSRFTYFPRSTDVVDADMDAQGNIYSLSGCWAVFNDPPSYGHGEPESDMKIVVRKNDEVLYTFDASSFHYSTRARCYAMQKSLMTDNHRYDSVYTGTFCDVGYVDTEGHWGFYLAFGGSGTGWKGTGATISLYYVNEQGMRLLMTTTGYSRSMEPISKTEYYGGAAGIKFPIHDGYYYTMVNKTAVSWGIYLPGIAAMTIYTPEGLPIVTDNFAVGTRFTILPMGENRYLLGVDERSVFVLSIGTSTGQDFSYHDDTVWIRDGLYLCEGGTLTKILGSRCASLRLRYMTNTKKWIKSLEGK